MMLLYESSPSAFIVERAGGKASNGCKRILDIVPASLHQKWALFIGSEEDVREAEEFLSRKD